MLERLTDVTALVAIGKFVLYLSLVLVGSFIISVPVCKLMKRRFRGL